jgi:DNA gyrase/topoisomerase IV subunit A
MRVISNVRLVRIQNAEQGWSRTKRRAGTRDQDFLEHMFVATNHQYMMFFTQKGKCFWMRVYEIPEGSKTSKGRAFQNLINIEIDDKVKAFICTQDLKDQNTSTAITLLWYQTRPGEENFFGAIF